MNIETFKYNTCGDCANYKNEECDGFLCGSEIDADSEACEEFKPRLAEGETND